MHLKKHVDIVGATFEILPMFRGIPGKCTIDSFVNDGVGLPLPKLASVLVEVSTEEDIAANAKN